LNLAQNQQAFKDAGINQAALDALAAAAAQYPSNDTSTGDNINTGGYRFNAPTPIKLNSNIARFDYTINSKQNLFVRLNVIDDKQILPQWLPGTVSPEVWNHPWGFVVGHTWTIGQNWVNSFRYGYTPQALPQSGGSSGTDNRHTLLQQPHS
jgi:hypothetical protein